MARTARTRTHFIETGTTVQGGTIHRDYVVEVRQGQVRWTVGRIMGSVRSGRGAWAALPVGADAWTAWHSTRAAATAALAAREDFRLAA
jgi:hypothetical protein